MELKPLDLPAASSLSPEALNGNGRFHGSKAAAFILEEEKPWHKAAALMFAAGAVTTTEVASAFGVCVGTVRNLLRQPWFQEQVTALMVEHGGRDIMSLFRAESFNSLVTLIELRDSDKTPTPVKRACAVDILDRALGKPIQRVETSEIPTSSDPVGEVKRLTEANERLRLSQSPPK